MVNQALVRQQAKCLTHGVPRDRKRFHDMLLTQPGAGQSSLSDLPAKNGGRVLGRARPRRQRWQKLVHIDDSRLDDCFLVTAFALHSVLL